MDVSRPRLLIVDDHPRFHESVGELLAAEGFEIVGSAFDGWQALTECQRLSPDIVLLDVQLPGLDGFEVAARLARDHPGQAVVLVSGREATTYGGRVDLAPVRGFVTKQALNGRELRRLVG